jgi:hypothetical protein
VTSRPTRPHRPPLCVRRGIAALVLALGALLVAPGTGTAATDGLSGDLLTAAVLPSGWAARPVPASNAEIVRFASQCPGRPFGTSGLTARADAAFQFEGGFPELEEALSTYRSGRAEFERSLHGLAGCTKSRFALDEGQVKVKFSPLSFPSTGDQSTAFALAFSVAGLVVDNDVVLVRQGGIVMAIGLSAVGKPKMAQLRQFVTLGLGSVIHASPG